MENKLVSVVIASYNQKNVIAETVLSVLAQTYKNLEIIISDDGSTDGTRELLESMAITDSRIKLHLQEKNLGITSNYNFLVNQATGFYVAIFSGDDLMLCNKIEKQVALMESKSDASFCHHSVVEIDYVTGEKQKEVRHQYKNNITTINDVLRNFGIPGSMTILYKNKIFKGEVFDSEIKTASDWLQIIDLCALGKGYYIDEILCKYRKDSGYNGKTPAKYENDFTLTIEKVRQKYGKNDKDICRSCDCALARYSLGASFRYLLKEDYILARYNANNAIKSRNLAPLAALLICVSYLRPSTTLLLSFKKLYKRL